MTAPTFNGCFPHNWTAEILPQRPMILPSRHYVYPGVVEEVERGALEVLVQPTAASPEEAGASLLPDPVLRPQEAMVLEVLRADDSLQIDGILEQLETQLTSSEVFTALFELEMAGRVRQLPGKNYVRTI